MTVFTLPDGSLTTFANSAQTSSDDAADHDGTKGGRANRWKLR